MPFSEFIRGPYQTALPPGELLASVRIPVPAAGTAIVHRKFSFHERPTATVTCAVRLEDGAVAEARIAVGAVGVKAVRATAAEGVLAGKSAADAAAVAEAAELAAEAAGAVDDAKGSAEYKQQLVRVLVQRCFAEAVT
jgi:carbon-monoxide dehydrogenase medium subunit